MPHRCKKINRSRVRRSIPLNINASKEIFDDSSRNSQYLTNVILQLESIGNSIINEIKGLESIDLKQQSSTSSSISNITTMQCTSSPSMKRSLQEIFSNLHEFENHIQRQYRTIGIGDDDIHGNITITQSNIESTSNGRKRIMNSKNGRKKKSNPTARTICTRSSTLNRLKNHQQEHE